MPQDSIKLHFSTSDPESTRDLLKLCQENKIFHKDVTARPPGREGHQLDLPHFDLIIQLASQIPWETVVPLVVDYIVKVIKDYIESKKVEGKPLKSVTVTIENGEPIVCRTEEDIDKLVQALRRSLN